MYASPVWLHKQIQLFKDLWARVLLKIVGSEYHTDKALTEVMLNLPPLEVQNEILTVKFLLKCLHSDDEMISILLTAEDDSQHPLFTKVQQVKRYILWKNRETSTRRCSINKLDLINCLQVDKLLYYSKEDMQEYCNKIWWQSIKHTHPYLDTDSWVQSNCTLLFPRGSHRYVDTYQAAFIHGHSSMFQNFCKKVGQSDYDNCIFCNSTVADSNLHQLFECSAFDCNLRDILLSLINNNIADFQWTISVTNNRTEKVAELISTFCKLVQFIMNESKRYI